ncbi:nucleotidyltransferase family protein [Cohnella nanjingensis]|nr:nucleotidyltransferase family protein [Cohnella nanjingensis]
MGRPKLSLELAPGRRLGGVALRSLLDSRVARPVIAVVRPDDPLDWLDGASGEVRAVPCPEAERGMSHSIRRGLREAMDADADAILVALADQPFVHAACLRGLAATAAADPALDFVACRYAGYDAPPALFRRSMFPALAALEGDKGARALLTDEAFRGRCVAVTEAERALDVDTPEGWVRAREVYSRMFGSEG